ncbi:protein BUNDLE SHEATH DEFECTIVE 2, chloroplastic-like isoform X2 [Primulina huaijiensis]|uniref:protein BUNDLE SHEATH DEFECTIVE 2, chloroplastic-like isoform X2 n=1 Tax=Primulina huaijiensis TaxID=1492673 RepID=UPI003CC77FC3
MIYHLKWSTLSSSLLRSLLQSTICRFKPFSEKKIKDFQEMANSLCFSTLVSLNTVEKRLIGHSYTSKKVNWTRDTSYSSKTAAFESLKVKATDSQPSTKLNSIICTECEGNGAKQCTQCKGNGINSVDHFNGQFKAGGLCWLCRGKKEILCGNCNGAGFMGGFMNALDS